MRTINVNEEPLIEPDAEITIDDGEHDTVCVLRDYLLIKNRNCDPNEIEALVRFYCLYIHKQERIYANLRHKSGRGMTRVISFYVVKDNDIQCIDWFIQAFLGNKPHKNFSGLIVKGSGMDMAWHIAYSLSRKLYGDGYRFQSKWI